MVNGCSVSGSDSFSPCTVPRWIVLSPHGRKLLSSRSALVQSFRYTPRTPRASTAVVSTRAGRFDGVVVPLGMGAADARGL